MSFAARIALFAVMFAACFAMVSAAQAETVKVQLHNGQSVTGSVHSRTNDAVLWIEFKGVASKVIRPLQRSHIAQVIVVQSTVVKEFTAESDGQRAIRLLADGVLPSK